MMRELGKDKMIVVKEDIEEIEDKEDKEEIIEVIKEVIIEGIEDIEDREDLEEDNIEIIDNTIMHIKKNKIMINNFE